MKTLEKNALLLTSLLFFRVQTIYLKTFIFMKIKVENQINLITFSLLMNNLELG